MYMSRIFNKIAKPTPLDKYVPKKLMTLKAGLASSIL
jgi:hypothetical protein